MEKYKLTINEFRDVYNGNITKNKYDELISKIDDRLNYIIRNVMASEVFWWDYSNGGPEKDGYFEPSDYMEDGFITLDGRYTIPEPYEYTDFPIRWLWEDFEEEFKNDVKQFKAEKEAKKKSDKEKRETLKVKKAEMKKIISEKLTKEELKFITFK